MHSALLSDARTEARSLVGEKQPAEVARSRLPRKTRALLTVESEFGEKRVFPANYGKVSGAVQRECRFLREREGVRFRCRQLRIQPPATPASGGFFLRSPERITPHFLSRSP